jgi:hypothetical protein
VSSIPCWLSRLIVDEELPGTTLGTSGLAFGAVGPRELVEHATARTLVIQRS